MMGLLKRLTIFPFILACALLCLGSLVVFVVYGEERADQVLGLFEPWYDWMNR